MENAATVAAGEGVEDAAHATAGEEVEDAAYTAVGEREWGAPVAHQHS